MQKLSPIPNEANKQQSPVLHQPRLKTSFFNPVVQPKLTINQPNDMHEQEAEALSDQVMRIPDPSVTNNLFFKPSISSIQRKCAHCEEEKKLILRENVLAHGLTHAEQQREAPLISIQKQTDVVAEKTMHVKEPTVQRQTGTTTTAQPTEAERHEYTAMQDAFFSAQGQIMSGQILRSAGFAEGVTPSTPADAERLTTFWGLSMSGIVSQMAQITSSLSTRVVGQITFSAIAQQQQSFIDSLTPVGRGAYQSAVQQVRNEPFWNNYFTQNEIYIFPDLQSSNRFAGYNQVHSDPNDPTGQRKIIIVHISAVYLNDNFPDISAATIIHELSHVIYEPAVLERALHSFENSIVDLLLEHPDIIAARGATADAAVREQQRQRLSQILYEALAYGEEEIFVHLQQLTNQPDVLIRHQDGSQEDVRGAQLIEREVLRYVRRLQRIGLEQSMLRGILSQLQRRVSLMYDRRIDAFPDGSRQREVMVTNKRMAELLFEMALRGQEL